MRVAYITMSFPAGPETFACTDVRTLRDRGTDVLVYSMRSAPRGADALLAQRGLRGLRVDYATVPSVLRGIAFALSHPGLALRMCAWIVESTWTRPRFLAISLALLPRSFDVFRRIERDSPDVVHLFWGHYPSLAARVVRWRLPQCVVSMFLGAYDLTYRYGPSAQLAREADIVWTHAHENVAAIEQLGVLPDRVVVVHRGVDVECFRPAAAKTPRRIACAARLCVEKHVDHVLQVFARVYAAWPDASLVIMGDGPDRRRLEDLARTLHVSNGVRFTGHVPQVQVRDEMAAAEYFLLMSQEDTERLTNAVKEAMACECLCIVTRSPGIDELLTDGVHGFVVDRGDTDRAAAMVAWGVGNPAAAAQIRLAAAARIRSSFDVVTSMAMYVERWGQLVSTRGPGATSQDAASTARRMPQAAHEVRS